MPERVKYVPCVVWSVYQDARYARNKNVPCVVLSCNKLHATWNYAWGVSVVHQDARYARNHKCLKEGNNVLCVVWLCIKMHATHEIVNV